MKTTIRRTAASKFAICVDNSEYPVALELHKLYRLIPDKQAERDGDLRVVDESGEDYLYPAENFALVTLPRNTVRALNKSYAQTIPSAI